MQGKNTKAVDEYAAALAAMDAEETQIKKRLKEIEVAKDAIATAINALSGNTGR